jgi:hypothetical protein
MGRALVTSLRAGGLGGAPAAVLGWHKSYFASFEAKVLHLDTKNG